MGSGLSRVVCERRRVVGLPSLHLKEDELRFLKVADGCAGAAIEKI